MAKFQSIYFNKIKILNSFITHIVYMNSLEALTSVSTTDEFKVMKPIEDKVEN